MRGRRGGCLEVRRFADSNPKTAYRVSARAGWNHVLATEYSLGPGAKATGMVVQRFLQQQVADERSSANRNHGSPNLASCQCRSLMPGAEGDRRPRLTA